MAYLALVRHGESDWNAMEMWTGWTDVSLSPKGVRQAKQAGEVVADIKWDYGFTSLLKRAKETLRGIEEGSGQTGFPVKENVALNERDYGNFTGLKKTEVEEKYGYDMFDKWHRGWDYPLPHGETLKDVYERVVPYYKEFILPLLRNGKNVIVSAHGNSLRALVKFLDNINDTDIERLEIPFADVYLYQVSEDGSVKAREVRKVQG